MSDSKSYNEYTREQLELLDIMNDELSVISTKQTALISVLNENILTSGQLLDHINNQITNLSRIGSASNIIGLKGLRLFCIKIINNFEKFKTININQYDIANSELLYWPEIIKAYLVSPNNPNYIHELVDFLTNENYPVHCSQEELRNIKKESLDSSIHTDEQKRIITATPDLVDLKISDEVDYKVFENLMLDLPVQIEKLSKTVRELNNNNKFLDKLKAATKKAHTIKGMVNIVGINGIANIMHCLEEVFEALLKENKKVPHKLYLSLLNATDCLEDMSDHLGGVAPPPGHSIETYQELLDWANSIHFNGIEDDIDESSQVSTKNDDQLTLNADLEKVQIPDHQLHVAEKLIDDLLDCTNEGVITSEQIIEISLSLKKSVQNLISKNSDILKRAHVVENILNNKFNHNALNSIDTKDIEKLHATNNSLLEVTYDSLEYADDVQAKLITLEKHSKNLVRHQYDSQETILEVRMVPIKSIIPRLMRAVKQACNSSNKLAELNVTGDDVLVDSGIVQQIADPIMHILRNAIDHGIEAPKDRIQNGKDPQGNIHLDFNVEGNSINVACKDDGCSLDLELIRSKAIAKNLLTDEDQLDNDNAIKLMLRHGFSTKDTVSQLSGRGVGLAAVYEKIAEMKGGINIDTADDNGMSIGFTIPVNLNSLHALLIKCDKTKLAISNRGVVEILHCDEGKIVSITGQYYFEYLQHRYPVYDLRFMLEFSSVNKPLDNKVVLIVRDDANNDFAITIDKIYETRDIIAKPISKLIPCNSGLLGTTVLGDGGITTVIDIVELIKHVQTLDSNVIRSLNVFEQDENQPLVIIVEDSISVRKDLTLFMQDMGFAAITAKNGVEALDKIKNKQPSLVITDLEMPHMDGITLSKHLRLNKETATTPIIIMISKDKIKERQIAENQCITSYISKPYNENKLLEVINSLDLTEHVVV